MFLKKLVFLRTRILILWTRSEDQDQDQDQDQSPGSVDKDPHAASGFGRTLWGKVRSKVPVRKSPYAVGSRHASLPSVVNTRPRAGKKSKH